MNELVFTERQHSDSDKWSKYADRDIIPAWVADSDYAAATPIIDALRARVEHGVFGYSVPSAKLIRTVCDYFAKRWNWHVQPEWILCSPGLGAGIHNSCRMAEGGGALTPQPIYHVFRNAPAIAGATRRDMPMQLSNSGEWQLPQTAMDTAIAAGDGRIFQLCNPHNPNGKVYTRDELLSIADFCCRHDLLIFADEVHADLTLDDVPHIPIASLASELPEIAARTITMQSPSKAYNIAGLNLAFIIIADDALRARYLSAGRGKIINHLNPFGYAAAQAAYSGQCDAWLETQRQHLRANRDRLKSAIDSMDGVSMPPLPSTYLAWIDVSALQLPDPPAHFVKHGIGMSPGADFGGPNHMRLNFACSPQRMEEIITRFGHAVSAA